MLRRTLSRRPRGRPPYPGTFTPAEQRVLAGLQNGHTYQRIADDLGLSYDTVKYHVSNMLAKAEVERREELVTFAARPGLRWSAAPVALAWVGGAAAAIGLVAFAAMVLLNRGGADEPAAPEVTPTVAASPSAVPTTNPQRASGIPLIDDFVAAALTGDSTRLAPFMDYRLVACANDVQGIGAPPVCPAGSPDGTLVPAVTAASCEGGYVTEAQMPGVLAVWDLGFDALFSVGNIPAGRPDEFHGASDYFVVLTFKRWADGTPVSDPRPGMGFYMSADGVVSWSSGCGGSARSLSARYPDDIVSRPPLPPAPADTPHTGVAAVDEVVDAIVVGDNALLATRTTTVQVGCGTDRWLPPCPRDDPAGTLVPAVVREGCDERTWAEPSLLAEDYETRLGSTPRIVAIAEGDGGDGVEVWVIWEGARAGAVGVTSDGEIAVIDGGCSGGAAEIIAKFDEFVVPPR